MQPGKARSVGALIDAVVRGKLSRTQALRLCKDNPEVITLALLVAGQRIAEQDARITELEGSGHEAQPSPSTPSGMVPVHAKPNAPKRHKKPGAKNGHKGVRRERPAKIDRQETHRLKCCRCCGGPLQRCERKRTRTIEDIPEEIEPVVSEHDRPTPRPLGRSTLFQGRLHLRDFFQVSQALGNRQTKTI